MRNFARLSQLLGSLAGVSLLASTMLAGCGDDGGDGTGNGSTPAADARPSIDADTNIPDADPNSPDADTNAPDAMPGEADGGVEMDGGMMDQGNPGMVWIGDVTVNNVDEIVIYDGTNPSNPNIPGVTELTDVLDFAVSPDGSKYAAAIDHDGNEATLYVFNADGSGNATELYSADDSTTLSSQEIGISNLTWSPDGQHLAFTSDQIVNNMNLPYVVPVDGSSAPILVSQNPNNSGQDATSLSWFDNTRLLFRGDLDVDNRNNFFITDISAEPIAPQALIPANDFVKEGDGARDRAFPAGGKVYFRSGHTDSFLLYRVDPNGQNLELVPSFASLNNNGGADQAQAGAFAISPDGTQIAFSADSPTADLYQVYVSTLDGNTPTVQSNLVSDAPASSSGPLGSTGIVWRPDGEMLGVIANWQLGQDSLSDRAAFVVPASGNPGGVRIWNVSNSGTSQDAASMRFSSDSSTLYLLGDMLNNNDAEVFATTDFADDNQDLTLTRVEEVPVNGDVFQLRPLNP